MTMTAATNEVENVAPLTLAASGAVVLSPAMVAKANRGKLLKDRQAADKKELDGLKTEFEALFVAANTREAVNASGKVVAIRTHGNPHRLNQGMLKAAHPALIAEFTFAAPWDSVDYPG